MDTMASTNQIRQSLVNSNLHYFVNESPHSVWITIRKKFLNTDITKIVEKPGEIEDAKETGSLQ